MILTAFLPTVALTLASLAPNPQQAPVKAAEDKMPFAKLAPSKIIPNLCLVHYHISTASPDCQAYFDKGLGYFYSYVWMEAARSFETAAHHDPDCAIAYLGLSRAMEEWKGGHVEALKKAQALLPKAGDRERRLITARLQLKGLEGKVEKD